MYITVEEYKELMGIATLSSVKQAQIEAILPQTKQIIDNMLGELNQSTRIVKVDYSNVFLESDITRIYTYMLGISGVISINGEAYTGQRKVDGHRHNVILLNGEYTLGDYPLLEIEVTNGYDPIPSDIKLLQALLTYDTINKLSGGELTSKKIGDKTLSFSTNTGETRQQFIKSIFDSYKIYSV